MLLTYNGDCIETMRQMPENSVDSIITDPPYELGFMGKSWDASGIAFNVEVWQEALRVLKPGGHLLAFSGSRTYHRMAVAIEDAGFEIRDQIMWVYGSGFPKSLDVSKAIDKAAGAEREIVGERRQRANSANSLVPMNASIDEVEYLTAPATAEAKKWQGWGTALKPAHEPIVVARKPLIGTVAENVLTFGTGGLNIDGGRVGSDGGTFKASKPKGVSHGIYGEGINGTVEIGQLNSGRWPANFIHDGSDEVLELFPNSKGGAFPAKRGQAVNTSFASGQETEGGFRAMGDDGSAARFFYCAKANKRDRNEGLDGFEAKREHDGRQEGKPGGSNPRNRTNDAKVNHHPTVKPTDLMRYLCRLVTQPNGLVLDPFMGSGSTGKACVYEGFSFIGIDQSAEYVEIANARIQFAKDHLGESE